MDLPDTSQIRWIVRTTATLLSHGAEPVRGLVQPTAEFFPDHLDGSPQTVAGVLLRVQEHAGLADIPVELAVLSPEGQAKRGGCSSGACDGSLPAGAGLERMARCDNGAYRVTIAAAEVRQPALLITAFIRAVSSIFLVESGASEALLPRDREPAIDLAAVLLGFGVLAANGSYVYMKGCGGVQVHSATRMRVEEVTLALAIYCRLYGVPARNAAKHLDVTPRAHFEEADVWASSNASLVRRLRDAPDTIAADDFALRESRSWLARVLGIGKGRPRKGAEDELDELERSLVASGKTAPKRAAGAVAAPSPIDEQRARKLAEIRALVDESLGS